MSTSITQPGKSNTGKLWVTEAPPTFRYVTYFVVAIYCECESNSTTGKLNTGS